MKQNIKISATNLLQEMMLHALGRFRTRHLPVQQGHAHQISPALTHKWGTDWGGGGGKAFYRPEELEFSGISLAAHDNSGLLKLKVCYIGC